MYGRRLCNAYLKGVKDFIGVAKQDKVDNGVNYINCLCKDCKNKKKFLSEYIVE